MVNFLLAGGWLQNGEPIGTIHCRWSSYALTRSTAHGLVGASGWGKKSAPHIRRMLPLTSIFADLLWVIGLASVLATLSYVSWYRAMRRWSWRHALNLPRVLIPFCVSIEILCIGLAVQGLTAYQPAPRWETLAWSILAVLFAIQTIVYGLAGMRYGWDTPVEGRNP